MIPSGYREEQKYRPVGLGRGGPGMSWVGSGETLAGREVEGRLCAPLFVGVAPRPPPCALPVYIFFFGKLLDGFGDNMNNPAKTAEVVGHVVSNQTWNLFLEFVVCVGHDGRCLIRLLWWWLCSMRSTCFTWELWCALRRGWRWRPGCKRGRGKRRAYECTTCRQC